MVGEGGGKKKKKRLMRTRRGGGYKPKTPGPEKEPEGIPKGSDEKTPTSKPQEKQVNHVADGRGGHMEKGRAGEKYRTQLMANQQA